MDCDHIPLKRTLKTFTGASGCQKLLLSFAILQVPWSYGIKQKVASLLSAGKEYKLATSTNVQPFGSWLGLIINPAVLL